MRYRLLVLDGQVVADGQASWALKPKINWWLRIDRGPEAAPIDEGDPFVAIPIPESAANYPGEVVWLMWRGVPSDLDPDIVYR